ncbi:hypothetical protein AKO1_013733 [Acrasis kona]|uniref:Uncharacterized protein n=1 Tax=Acrasis kona TaxID=1008807 RepID=A0AAW2ZIS5_9EUKA
MPLDFVYDSAVLLLSIILNLILLPFYIVHQLYDSLTFKPTAPPKSVLITGASSGIGESLAKTYAANGTKNLILLGRNEEKLKRVKEICQKKGANVAIYVADVTDREKMDEIIKSQPNLDLVIANAGVSQYTIMRDQKKTKLDDSLVKEDMEREVININLHGVLNTVYPAIRYFLQHNKNKTSQICIVSSKAAQIPMLTNVYGCTKGYVTNFAFNLRREYASKNIRVNNVLPCWVETSMADAYKGDKFFMISSDKAAKIIIDGLSNDTPNISFTFATSFMMDITSNIPWFYQLVLQKYIRVVKDVE